MVPLGRSTCGLLFLTDVSESSNPTTSRAQSEGESCKLGPELEQLKYKSLELLACLPCWLVQLLVAPALLGSSLRPQTLPYAAAAARTAAASSLHTVEQWRLKREREESFPAFLPPLLLQGQADQESTLSGAALVPHTRRPAAQWQPPKEAKPLATAAAMPTHCD